MVQKLSGPPELLSLLWSRSLAGQSINILWIPLDSVNQVKAIAVQAGKWLREWRSRIPEMWVL